MRLEPLPVRYHTVAVRGIGPGIFEAFMKVDVFTAPLSEEGKALLKDQTAAQELLYKLLNGAQHGPFEVKAGERTFDVRSTDAVVAPSRSR